MTDRWLLSKPPRNELGRLDIQAAAKFTRLQQCIDSVFIGAKHASIDSAGTLRFEWQMKHWEVKRPPSGESDDYHRALARLAEAYPKHMGEQ